MKSIFAFCVLIICARSQAANTQSASTQNYVGNYVTTQLVGGKLVTYRIEAGNASNEIITTLGYVIRIDPKTSSLIVHWSFNAQIQTCTDEGVCGDVESQTRLLPDGHIVVRMMNPALRCVNKISCESAQIVGAAEPFDVNFFNASSNF